MAAASPASTRCDAVSIESIVAGGVGGIGRARLALDGQLRVEDGQRAAEHRRPRPPARSIASIGTSSERRLRERREMGSAPPRSETPARRPSSCVAAQAFSASSGPMPDGSPRVSAIGRSGCAGAGVMIGRLRDAFTMTALSRNSFSRLRAVLGDFRGEQPLRDGLARGGIVLGGAFVADGDHLQPARACATARSDGRRASCRAIAATLR